MNPTDDSLYMKIMPIKAFIRVELPKFKDRSKLAVIFCTTSPLRTDYLRNTRYIHACFEDVNTCHTNALDIQTARRIAVFVDEINADSNIRRLFVCCDEGRSRSPAIAAAIARYFDQSDKQIWTNPKFHPNEHVFKTQCHVFDVDVSKRELQRLVRLNECAFKKAIRNSSD